MGEWRVGGKLKRTLYRDEQLVGLVDTAEIAREIVHRMNLIIPIVVPDGLESGRERSREPFVAVRAETCGSCLSPHDVGADNRFEVHVNSSGHDCSGSRQVAP